MKNKLKNILIITSSLIILYFIILKKDIIYNSIFYGINIWLKYLLPSLFPFFIISDILINYNINYYIPKKIKNIFKKTFNITDNMFTIVTLSLLGGFPSCARNINTMYKEKSITKEEANHLLLFSHFSNPVFILITIPLILNINNSYIILISHYISSLIIAFLIKKKFHHKESILINNTNKLNFGKILIDSINKSVDSLLTICGITVVFYLVSTIIVDILKIDSYSTILIKGLFEITSGIEALKISNISQLYKTIIATCFLSFGGFGVHLQTKSYLIETDADYKYFLIGRIYQTIISGIICFILAK